MAKAHCENHKRFVPTCESCKSAALRETVGFPAQEEKAMGGITGAPEDAVPVADIPDYEPDEEEPKEDPWADGKTPAEGDDVGDFKPPDDQPTPEEPVEPVAAPSPLASALPALAKDIDETEAAGESDPEPVAEIDGEGNVVPLVPGEEGQSGVEKGPTQMSPIEMAVAMFPPRLMSDEVAPFIEKALGLYLEAGLTPEDAVICVAGEAIHAEHPEIIATPEEVEEEVQEAFEAGVEAAPEISGCIEDYNQGYNDGMTALRTTLRDYYAGDEDSVAYALGLWLDEQMRGMRK